MIKVKYSEVIFIESMKDYVKIVRNNDKPLLAKQSISSLEEILPPNLFLRIHRFYILAINKIAHLQAMMWKLEVEKYPLAACMLIR